MTKKVEKDMDTTSVNIVTKRLHLTPISKKYREDIFKHFTKKVTRWMFPQPTGNIADIDTFIAESIDEMKKGENLQFVATDKETGEFLGCPAIHHIDRKDPAMGMWFKEQAHGKGYGKEAMSAIKKWADEHLEYDYIKYPVAVENIASRKVAESLGGLVVREYTGENQLGDKMEEVEYHIPRVV